ncbi:hypothetical protein FDK38_001457 [Candidozyma auris]|nr:hypothetical protein FDK38_001457 [[Candida] auris]
MASYLHESSKLLYEYSENFNISLDLIQRLAQFLKLDTFIDSEVQDPQTKQSVKRLSIAGSLLLVDIDFIDSHTVTKVALASGNHSTSAVSSAHSEENAVISTTKVDDTTVVRVNFLEANFVSFLNIRNDNDASVAENILKENLCGPKLGKFPSNLKYLANLDRLSPPEGDLVLYLDNIAKYLEVVHMQECKLRPDDEDIRSGQSSIIGKLIYNDIQSLELGVFLQFWKTKNKTKTSQYNEVLEHQTYVGRLSVIESEGPNRDYLKEATKSLWEPRDQENASLEYKITFDDEKHLPKGVSVCGPNNKQWELQLNLNHPVYLPREIIDYLGFDKYEVAKDTELKEMFDKIIEFGSVDLMSESKNLKVQLDLKGFSDYIPLTSVSLPNLNSIAKLLPSLRNHILLFTWITEIAELPDCCITDATETEAKKQKDVHPELAEEEVLRLNAMTESNAYVGVQVLDSNANTDVEDFFKQEDEDENMDKDNIESEAATPQPQAPFVKLQLNDIDFSSRLLDLQFSISGRMESGTPIEGSFKLQNGAFIKAEDDKMEGSKTKSFIDALELSEDLLQALENAN